MNDCKHRETLKDGKHFCHSSLYQTDNPIVSLDFCEWCPVRNLDAAKRTAQPKSRGLGDTIAKVTTALGIKPCGGCKKRQELLNKLLPYSGA
jgi:hypothetical protein